QVDIESLAALAYFQYQAGFVRVTVLAGDFHLLPGVSRWLHNRCSTQDGRVPGWRKFLRYLETGRDGRVGADGYPNKTCRDSRDIKGPIGGDQPGDDLLVGAIKQDGS